MKNVFSNVRTRCCVCNSPLSGESLLRRGNKYYCQSDFERTSYAELHNNWVQDKRLENYTKIFGKREDGQDG